MASTKLQCKIDDYVRDEMKIPLVSELGFTGSEDKHHAIAPSGLIYVNLFIRKQKAPLFELSLKLRLPPMDFVEEIERETASSSITAIDDSFKYQLLLDPLLNFHYKSYWDYLMKSLGPRVNFASFFGCNDEEFTSICSNLSVPFENMGVVMEQLSDNAMDHLFRIITSSKVEHISLQVGDVTAADPKQALLKLATLVRAIIIIQDPVSNIDAYQPYLFGVNDGDWAATFEEMFTKTMSKLYIENNAYREYLSSEAAGHLLKNLPTEDKTIWFKASFFKEIDLAGSGEVNDHIIKVAPMSAQKGHPMLSIIHSSRLRENENIRAVTGIRDWNQEALRRKAAWSLKLREMNIDQWSRSTTVWIPYNRKRPQGQPKARWRDDLRRTIGDNWWSAPIEAYRPILI